MEEFYLVTAIGVADKSFIVYLFVCPNDYLISLVLLLFIASFSKF